MSREKWQVFAIQEGRVCVECNEPMTKGGYAVAQKKYGGKCWVCRAAHWQVPLYTAGGSVSNDNAGREALDYLREYGK